MKNSKRDIKKRRWCVCRPTISLSSERVVKGVCKAGFCTEFRCPDCNAILGGWGPMGCKCEGYIRWMWYPAMAPSFTPSAKKPSLPSGRHKGRVA
jgi:hypothetical protein